MSKSLDIKIRETKDFGAHALACANRYGLDHDCAGYGLRTRLDVTGGLWTFLRRRCSMAPDMWICAQSHFSHRLREEGHPVEARRLLPGNHFTGSQPSGSISNASVSR